MLWLHFVILCLCLRSLGKNYLEHAKELGDAVPDKPVIFLKPPSSAVVASSQQGPVAVQLPRNRLEYTQLVLRVILPTFAGAIDEIWCAYFRGHVHYEAEMLLRLNDDLEVDAVSLGLDLTLRELQSELKKKGHPWEIAKVISSASHHCHQSCRFQMQSTKP
jgi:2-keto-4-pentenoate hydratase/2-oxohepta-3-ene-1,7-dioic acid hydratase in catechol pathway